MPTLGSQFAEDIVEVWIIQRYFLESVVQGECDG
jgi:hypothetical protein